MFHGAKCETETQNCFTGGTIVSPVSLSPLLQTRLDYVSQLVVYIAVSFPGERKEKSLGTPSLCFSLCLVTLSLYISRIPSQLFRN
jgi:hypothetical protein